MQKAKRDKEGNVEQDTEKDILLGFLDLVVYP